MNAFRRREEDSLNWFQRNWEMVIFAIGLVFAAGGLYATLINHEPRISCLESKIAKVDVMANDIAWIKSGIEELKNKR